MRRQRSGHYVKPTTRLVVPSVLFAVRVVPALDCGGMDYGINVSRFYRADVSVVYRRNGQWRAPQSARLSSPELVREWMRERASRRRVNWVIADGATDTLTLLEWWSHAERTGIRIAIGKDRPERKGRGAESGARITLTGLVAGARFDLAEYVEDGTRYRWVGVRNYWPDGITVARDGVIPGRDDLRVGLGSGNPGMCVGDFDATGLLAPFVRLVEWWARVASAPFGRSAAQLGWGVLRSRLAPRTLLTHDDDDAHRLERCASYGGRASIWRVGEIAGGQSTATSCPASLYSGSAERTDKHLFQLDVSSMYPTLLRDERFPVRLASQVGRIDSACLVDLAQSFGVIARVRFETDDAEYPVRVGDRVTYPVGRITTVLTGPEILALAQRGKILRVGAYRLYHLGRPFRESMELLLSERQRAKNQGDADSETTAKLLANSLAGKLAQRQGKWTRRSALDYPGRWGHYPVIASRDGKSRAIRYLAGCAWEFERDETGRGPHTYAFAYLAAYGRLMMRRIREACPPKSVVSQDTDGLWVLAPAVDALKACALLAEPGPGKLRIVRTAQTARFFGPRHYRVDGVWTLSGMNYDSVEEDKGRARVTVRTPLFNVRANTAPRETISKTFWCKLPGDLSGGEVGEDGWVVPKRINARWREDD